MECHIGYCGRPSEAFSNADGGEVQRRIATKVITPAQWLNEGQYFRDVAFVKVDPPFIGNLRPFTTGNLSDERRAPRVGVVGYPADKFVSDNSGRHDWGARMWQDFQAIEYDPQNSAYNRALEYRNVSTWGGKSLLIPAVFSAIMPVFTFQATNGSPLSRSVRGSSHR